MTCRDCSMVSIQGIACHETGCPSSPVECHWCGSSCLADSCGDAIFKSRRFCSHSCAVSYNGDTCDCPECDQFTETDIDSALATLGGAL